MVSRVSGVMKLTNHDILAGADSQTDTVSEHSGNENDSGSNNTKQTLEMCHL